MMMMIIIIITNSIELLLGGSTDKTIKHIHKENNTKSTAQ
jgi:hypothetical protein